MFGTTVEGVSLISVSFFGVGSASFYAGVHNGRERCSDLFPWSAWNHVATVLEERHVRALFWPLIAWSAWSQQATVLAGTTGEVAALASVRSVGEGLASHSDGLHSR
jgi:hypothetical protein